MAAGSALRELWSAKGQQLNAQGEAMAPKRAFTQAKQQALTKHDKSSATSFDARVVGLCAAANDSPYVYTTSSCSGRHLLWRGEGVKATQSFARGRVSHDRVDAAYFLDHDVNDQAPSRKAPRDAARADVIGCRGEWWAGVRGGRAHRSTARPCSP